LKALTQKKKKEGVTPRSQALSPRGDLSPRTPDESKTESSHFFSSPSSPEAKGTAEQETPNIEINVAVPSIPHVKEVYHVGLIDFLSRYYLAKKTAHFFKSALWEDQMLSTVPPEFYANRFKEYLPTIFPELTKSGHSTSDNTNLQTITLTLPTSSSYNGNFQTITSNSTQGGLKPSSSKKAVPRALTEDTIGVSGGGVGGNGDGTSDLAMVPSSFPLS